MIFRRTLLTGVLSVASGLALAAEPIAVAVSFSILADLVREVGGDRVRVASLVGPNQDLHEFQPRPSDVLAIAGAELFIVNGLGIEGWTTRIAQAAKVKRPPVVASRGVTPRIAKEGGHQATDPHAWQDVRNVKLYAANIADALASADPANAGFYRDRATSYQVRLAALDAEVRAAYAPIPRAQRRIVTTHDALGYYGAAYGIDFYAPQGMSTEGEPSAKELAALIGQIRRDRIRALFVENIGRAVLLEQVARETNVRIGGQLFSDALSPANGPAGTYVDMIRHNTRLIAGALAPG